MISIIPKPQHLQLLPGDILLSTPIKMAGINGLLENLDSFPSIFGSLYQPASPGSKTQLLVNLDPGLESDIGAEGYRLNISSKHVVISAGNSAGLFYGLQTLRQLLPPDPGGEISLPCLLIVDQPRYEWRGFMLDEARHFFGVETVKQVLDWLAFFKINRFHWHLTDYQGWRVEVERYPLLTEVGGRRDASQRRSFSKGYAYMDPTPHQGWYTQAEIREIVSYAAARNIIIIPELDLPGHFTAALAAYPELGCTKEQMNVRGDWGIFEDVACVGSPETREFLYGVLDELTDLFPGPYFHLGGDEVKTAHWQSCPDCQRVKQENDLDNFAQLNSLIMNDLGKYLHKKGKIPIVWNEALGPILNKQTVIMHWTPHPFSFSKTRRALMDGYKVILQPFWESYFDYAHSFIPLKRVYRAKILDKISPSAMVNVLGVQGSLWTEFVEDEQRIQWNTFPRLAAKAEVGWSRSGDRNYRDFQQRWTNLQPHLQQIGLHNPAPLETCNPSSYRRSMALAHDVLQDMHAEQKRWEKV